MAVILDQVLVRKIARKSNKSEQSVREQISKKATRLGIVSQAAQILLAQELGIGAARTLRALPPHVQDQVRTSLPAVFANPPAARNGHRQISKRTRNADTTSLASQYLLADAELRSRCGDLLRAKKHFDRVFREATTVLDHRIKKLADIKGNMNPVNVVGKALNPDPSKATIVVSKEPAEQEGFHSICKGLMLAFRNPSHHTLDDRLNREDALKFCGFVDSLLAILGRAEVNLSAT